MKSNIDTEKELELLRDLVSRLFAEYDGIFICGQSNDKDSSGMPKQILVCPSEGVDQVRVYKLKPLSSSRSGH